MARLSVTDLLTAVFDERTAWEFPVSDPAVLAGEALLRGRRVAWVAGDGDHMGGSIGVNGGEFITAAIERATAEGLPVVAFPIGGGTRMQEGTPAFLQMVKITGAVMAHKAENLPYLTYLRHPTMGGVFASWGSLGHVTLAEPGALVGFLGPRVYEALYGEPFPSGVQLSDNLAERGVIDAVCTHEELADAWHRLLTVMMARRDAHLTSEDHAVAPPSPAAVDLPDVPAWESVLRTRRDDRPGIRELLLLAATDVTLLNGTGDGESHPGSVLALARFGEAPCVVVGQDRDDQATPLDAAALREVRRGIRLARELRLPLVSVIDTPGAALSKEAEERGLAPEIARTLSDLITLPTPTVSLLMGQGTGGIALALNPADRVLASQHAWLAPLPPEGASAIMHRTVDRAADMAAAQGVRSADLLASGIVDRIIPEPADPAADREGFCTGLGDALREELLRVMALPRKERRAARARRYRSLGL
ncbi:MAG: carboxyl transferase domain-containing protein [Propionibacteriaceae bacterium]|nr:carboxyl transferase domain-containing protein [Propionibacteriaceae bacterium]